MKKRLLPALLALVMVLGLLPLGVFAATGGTETDPVPDTPDATVLKGTVEEYTTEMTDQGEETYTDADGKTAPLTKISVKPDSEVHFAAANGSIGRPAGYYVGVKLLGPTGANIDAEQTPSSEEGKVTVKFRNSNNGADRDWRKATVDGGDGTAESPYFMYAWNGISPVSLKNGATGSTAHWYFNWDNNAETGVTIPASEFVSTEGEPLEGATDMKGVDQIFEFQFNIMQEGVKLVGTADDENVIVWDYKPAVEITGDADQPASVTESALNSIVYAAAADSETNVAKVTVTTGSGIEVPASSIAVAAENNVNVAVTVGGNTVTLPKAALDKITESATEGDVSITMEKVDDPDPDSSDYIVPNIPTPAPDATADAPTILGFYNVKVEVGGTSVDWGTGSAITLTVDKPTDAGFDLSTAKVYLDGVLSTAASESLEVNATDESKLDITVPHLTSVALLSGEITTYGITDKDTDTTKGSYTVTVNDQEVTAAAPGDEVHINLEPEANYMVTNVIVKQQNGQNVTVTPKGEYGSFTMPSQPVTVTVKFDLVESSVVITEPENGTVTVDGEDTAGSQKTITATPDEDYVVDEVSIVDSESNPIPYKNGTTANTYVFTMPADDVTVTVTFTKAYECMYFEDEEIPVDGEDPNNGVYFENTPLGGTLTLNELQGETTYLLQYAKKGAYGPGNCVVVIFETGELETSKEVDVLRCTGGYTVSLFKVPADLDNWDVRDLLQTNLFMTDIEATEV